LVQEVKYSLRKLYLIYNKINLSAFSIYHYVNIKYGLSGFNYLDYFFLLTKNSESYINYNFNINNNIVEDFQRLDFKLLYNMYINMARRGCELYNDMLKEALINESNILQERIDNLTISMKSEEFNKLPLDIKSFAHDNIVHEKFYLMKKKMKFWVNYLIYI
jgi:hypothetical protein